MALCKLWRSIVLRDEAAMEKYSNALGVKGEDTDPYSISSVIHSVLLSHKKNQQSDFSRFAPQSTSCSARCCCSGPSTCGSWVCPTSWVERRRPTCARWPATASTASCRCSSRCLGPCCSSSATSTRSEASTSHWERRWTATLSWQRGECSVLSHLTHK